MTKQFEEMTISEIRKLHKQFINQNPEIKTAQDLLDDLNKEKEVK